MRSRQTRQFELLNQLIEQQEGFFSAQELFEQVQKQDHNIGIATIYRFLADREKTKELNSYVCDRKKIYSSRKSHCHFICEKTGKIIHFEIDSLDFLKDKIPGTITSFNIEIKGICNTCNRQD